MENLLLLGDLDSESDGWILEKSLAETARWNLDVIKNLGKCYNPDDDDDPNINVPRPQESQEEPTAPEVTARRKEQAQHLPV